MNSAAMEENDLQLSISDVGKAEELMNLCRMDHPDDNEAWEEMLNKLLNSLLQSKKQITGEADDFHNFSISILKVANDYRSALEIVRAGLMIHDTNTDLLADAIRYGYNCGEKEACKEWFDRLNRIGKKRWTWRAFSFGIDYLLELYADSSEEGDEPIDPIIDLARSFQHYYPTREDGWISEQQIYTETNDEERGVQVLEEAIQKLPVCPKCWLRYADIMVERGEYDKASSVLKKLRRTPTSGDAVNKAYTYYLDGICQMTKLMNSEEYETQTVKPEDVQAIYRTFYLASTCSDIRENIKKKIDQQIRTLEIETDTECPYDI